MNQSRRTLSYRLFLSITASTICCVVVTAVQAVSSCRVEAHLPIGTCTLANSEVPDDDPIESLKALGARIRPFDGRNDELLSISFHGSNQTEVPFSLLSKFGRPFVVGLDQKNVSDNDIRRLCELEYFRGVQLLNAAITNQGVRHLAMAKKTRVIGLYSCANITDDGIKDLAMLPELRHLHLQHLPITDAATKALKDLPLIDLDLQGTKVTDAASHDIAQIHQLKFLNLAKTRISDTALGHLSGLKKLYRLHLNDTDVTNAGIRHVSELRELRWLSLPARISDEGLGHLASMPHLRSFGLLTQYEFTDKTIEIIATLKRDNLNLSGVPHGRCQVTDSGLKHLMKMNGLKKLLLWNQPVTNKGLIELGKLEGLEELYLAGTKVTDAGLVHLTKLSRARVIDLSETGVTQSGVEELQKALPKCTIQWSGPAPLHSSE